MSGGWLCEACRSYNKSRDTRCYSCRVPRRAVEHVTGAGSDMRPGITSSTTPLELAVRGGARYRPSWLIALLIVPLVLAVAILDAILWPSMVGNLDANGQFVGDAATSPLWKLVFVYLGTMTATGAVWVIWMAVCLGNVPALTGQWPGFGVSDALFSPLGRRSGYYRPMQIMREIVDSFAGARTWPGVLVTVWWATWLGTIFVPAAIGIVRMVLGGSIRQVAEPLVLRPVLMAIAALLAIGVLIVVEWLQLLARRAIPDPIAVAPAPTVAAVPAGPPSDPVMPVLEPTLEPAASPLPSVPFIEPKTKRRARPGLAVAGLLVVVGVLGVALVGSGLLPRDGTDTGLQVAAATTPPAPASTASTPSVMPARTGAATIAPVAHPVIARMLAYVGDPGASGRWETITTVAARESTTQIGRLEVARSGHDGWVRTWAPNGAGDLGVLGEMALIGDLAYHRTEGRPWDESAAEPDAAPPVLVGAGPTDRLTYEGRVRREGVRLHRVGFERYGAMMTRSFEDAFADHDPVVTTTSGWVLVRDDGTPVVLTARVDGTIDGGTPAVLRVITTYRDMGTAVRVALGDIPPPVR